MKKIKCFSIFLSLYSAITFTSCSKPSIPCLASIDWNIMNGRYVFQSELFKEESHVTNEQATKLYFDNITPKILAEEFIKRISDDAYNESIELVDYKWCKYSIYITALDNVQKRVSGQFNFDYKCSVDGADVWQCGEINFENVPLALTHPLNKKSWTVTWKGIDESHWKFPDYYWDDELWSFSCNSKNYVTQEITQFTINHTSKTEYEEMMIAIDLLTYHSWWFLNVAPLRANKIKFESELYST